MPKRVTIVIDDDVEKAMRLKQSKRIIKNNETCSFSRMINDTLRRNLK